MIQSSVLLFLFILLSACAQSPQAQLPAAYQGTAKTEEPQPSIVRIALSDIDIKDALTLREKGGDPALMQRIRNMNNLGHVVIVTVTPLDDQDDPRMAVRRFHEFIETNGYNIKAVELIASPQTRWYQERAAIVNDLAKATEYSHLRVEPLPE